MLVAPITERQFTALMKICSIGHGGASYKAMKSVYVEGKTLKEAAEYSGIAYNTVAAAKRKVEILYPSIDARIALLQEARG